MLVQPIYSLCPISLSLSFSLSVFLEFSLSRPPPRSFSSVSLTRCTEFYKKYSHPPYLFAANGIDATIKDSAHAIAWYLRSNRVDGFNFTTLIYSECVIQHTHDNTAQSNQVIQKALKSEERRVKSEERSV